MFQRNMVRDSERPMTTLFQPHGSLQDLTEYFDSIPHYLFRTSSPRSSGTTTKTCVESAAVKYNFNQDDILRQDWAKAVEMLESHLLWRNWTTDNLMSWTSSFLFAVQHAIRRQATDRPPSAPGSIHISILDTRKLPRGTFLPAVALLEAYNIESKGKLNRDYYYGEYLSQGRMDLFSDTMAMTTLEALIDHGLYELYPPFADETEKTKLCSRVLQLRESFKDIPEVPSTEEISLAQHISVGCFLNISIRPVITMNLLSLRPRYRLDIMILEAFRENCWGTFVSDHSLECYRATSEYVPEHKQFTEMMHDVHAYTRRERQLERAKERGLKENRANMGQSLAGLSGLSPPEREAFDLSAFMDELLLTCHHSDTNQSFSGDSDISSEWGYGPEEEDYDSYEETCQNNMRDIDDLMREWAN